MLSWDARRCSQPSLYYVEKSVLVVNGELNPMIEVVQGNLLEASPDHRTCGWHLLTRSAMYSQVLQRAFHLILRIARQGSPDACIVAQVTIYNHIPADWPLVSEGISIHWHGFSMNGVPWYDGVGYLAQCPIKSGANFTYRFQASSLSASRN